MKFLPTAALFMLMAGTATAQMIGGFSSTNRYERVEALVGETFPLEWKGDPSAYILVEGTFAAPTGTGSACLRFAGLTLTWDSVPGNLQLTAGLPRDFAAGGGSATAQQVAWRVYIHRATQAGQDQIVRLHVFDGKRWVRIDEQKTALRNLKSWVESGGVIEAGAANAEISGVNVKMHRSSTLFIVAELTEHGHSCPFFQRAGRTGMSVLRYVASSHERGV